MLIPQMQKGGNMPKCKTTIISFEDFSDDNFTKPSNYYVRIATGDFYFIHTRDRLLAQQFVDNEFGKGHYKVNASKMSKASGTESAVGRLGSKSRQGLKTKGK